MVRGQKLLAWTLLLLALSTCGGGSEAPSAGRKPAAQEDARTPQTSVEAGPLVLFFGDSLTAGLHLSEEQAFPAQVQHLAMDAGCPFRLINAGISGDTTSGGLERLPWSLKPKPDLVVLALGANDGLRGIPTDLIESNLRAMLGLIRASGARVLLLGMRLPPNYGQDYVDAFEAIFPSIAQSEGLAWVPFFLEGVAGIPRLNLTDGIHPTAEGHRMIAKTVFSALRGMLGQP